MTDRTMTITVRSPSGKVFTVEFPYDEHVCMELEAFGCEPWDVVDSTEITQETADDILDWLLDDDRTLH